MLGKLKKQVLEANLEIKNKDLILYTWGNVSGIDRDKSLIVIKPSGVPYQELTVDKMVIVNLKGKLIEGELRPSSDTATHLFLYNNFSNIKGVVHTHSPWATSWAQAKKNIPCYGTTHADHFYQDIPCTRVMSDAEINNNYETNTGKVILEEFTNKNRDYHYTPGVLVAGHGPFTWGEDVEKAVYNSVVLEEIAKIAFQTCQLNDKVSKVSDTLLNKHFFRKHGKDAYYGQQ